mgnify:CR=1 FL=1
MVYRVGRWFTTPKEVFMDPPPHPSTLTPHRRTIYRTYPMSTNVTGYPYSSPRFSSASGARCSNATPTITPPVTQKKGGREEGGGGMVDGGEVLVRGDRGGMVWCGYDNDNDFHSNHVSDIYTYIHVLNKAWTHAVRWS